MKTFFTSVLLLLNLILYSQFSSFFENKTLRIDYEHSGNAIEEYVALKDVMIEPYWGGSHSQLIDTFRYGKYFFELVHTDQDSILYSRGFSTIFGEWQTTEEANKLTRSFTESLVMPLPKMNAEIRLYSRNKQGIFEKIFTYYFSPDDYFVRQESPTTFPTFDIVSTGDPSEKVDIVILPEGYTTKEMGKFIEDCHRFAKHLFSFAPYNYYDSAFNIRGVLCPSQESGADIPGELTYTNTALNASYYTFDSERYCMTYNFNIVRDLAANAPYDQIYILLNTEKYGGGGIYNFYSMTSSGNLQSPEVFIHEFGHGFAGLGDEYYNSEVSYSEFYPLEIEPWEPNLTTLVDFDRKWRDLLDPKTPVPTPNDPAYSQLTGVFEGGGYVAKGVYRPAFDCLMNSFNGNSFCEVCQKSIEDMIRFYTE